MIKDLQMGDYMYDGQLLNWYPIFYTNNFYKLSFTNW